MKGIKHIRAFVAMLLVLALCTPAFLPENAAEVYAADSPNKQVVFDTNFNVYKDNKIEDVDSYVLAVSSGNKGCDNIDKILIKYQGKDIYASGTPSGIYTQILYPSATADEYAIEANVVSFYNNPRTIRSLNLHNLAIGYFYSDVSPAATTLALSGSRYSTYAPLIGDSDVKLNADIIKSIFDCDESCFEEYLPYTKIYDAEKETLFRANTVEYLHFRTEVPIEQVIEVSFVMNNDGGDDWVLNGWTITEVAQNFTKITSNFDPSKTYYDYPLSGSNSDYYEYTGPQFTSYAKMSNALGLAYTGTVIASYQDFVQDGSVNAYDININTDVDCKTYIASAAAFTDSVYTQSAVNTGNYLGEYEYFSSVTKAAVASPNALMFEIDISDSYGSGFSSLIAYEENSSIVWCDCLYASVGYKDNNGFEQEVKVPVISSSLLDYAEMHDSSDKAYDNLISGNLKCYAQEGMSLFFTVEFPDFKELTSVTLTMDNPCDPDDSVNISNIKVYEAASVSDFYKCLYNDNTYIDSTSSPSVMVPDNYQINLKVSDAAVSAAGVKWLYESAYSASSSIVLDSSGSYITYDIDNSQTSSVSGDRTGVLHTPQEYTSVNTADNLYLVTLTTDDVAGAGTQDEVYVTINYENTSGTAVSTPEYTISQAIQSVYGENKGILNDSEESSEEMIKTLSLNNGWIGVSKTNLPKVYDGEYTYNTVYSIDGNYVLHMGRGGSVSFPVEMDDFSKITSIEFRMDNSDDVWQLDKIEISKITSQGERKIHFIDDTDMGDFTVRYYTEREMETVGIGIQYSNLGLMIQESDTVTYTPDTNTITATITSRDYTDYYYSMSHDIAMSNLRFTDSSRTYEVVVSVASNVDSGVADDGTGSNNLFYFQLEFEEGTSGVVLANSQIAADGFRAGKDESFYIITNEDFGDVTGIRIIPDDVTDDNEKLDKLCIEKIEVIRNDASGANKVYVFDNIGWINMEYMDSETRANSSGRTLSELATIANVSSYSYITSLEFAFAYSEYDEDDVQFEGDMFMDIVYLNEKGEKKTRSDISLAKAMYDYSRRTAHMNTDGLQYQSDTEFMFRGGSIDRFTVEIDDISSLISVTLKGYPLYETNLVIKEICVSVVRSTGSLKLNKNGEYQMVYQSTSSTSGSAVSSGAVETENIVVNTVTNRKFPTSFNFTAGDSASSYICRFDSNTVPSVEAASAESQTISRLPSSSNDIINLFVYLNKGNYDVGYTTTPSQLTLKTSVEYASASTGNNYRTDFDSYKITETNDGYVLSATGDAKYMSLLKYLTINASGYNSGVDHCFVDHVVIQQVRSNTVIATYNVAVAGSDACTLNGVTYFSSSTVESSRNSQVVTLLLAAGTTPSSITAEKRDIAVRLNYHSSIGSTAAVYSSENVFLSDSGTMSIDGGSLLTFTFNEANVKDITSITIDSNLKSGFVVDCGTIELLETDDDGYTESKGLLSMNPNGNVDVGTQTKSIDVTSSEDSDARLKKAEFIFETMMPTDGYKGSTDEYQIDDNGSAQIAMRITYITTQGAVKYKDIEDIREVSGTDGDYTQGGRATVVTYLPGARQIGYIQLMPVGTTQSAWNLKSVSYSLSGTNQSNTATVMINSRIPAQENNDISKATVYSLSTMTVNLNLTGLGVNRVSQAAITNAALKSGSGSYEVTPGALVTVGVDISGAIGDQKNYSYKLVERIDGTDYVKDSVQHTTVSAFTVSMPAVLTKGAVSGTFVLTVYTEDEPQKSSEVTLIVKEDET